MHPDYLFAIFRAVKDTSAEALPYALQLCSAVPELEDGTTLQRYNVLLYCTHALVVYLLLL